ncbi:MAG: hypothetical protein CVT63_04585 [Candidatus Anoxymicrobium japonicum]|uniref:Uncharacterized protein n=1 Tax=Candidatus Anoxymicrobium japonicum TaxID=2013648 RepID=A0A2N3G5T8_9ACTN|nr:MAG: hypothetical protein CVT63_04585 [Candidatus Anoxymicrobium japonicum]
MALAPARSVELQPGMEIISNMLTRNGMSASRVELIAEHAERTARFAFEQFANQQHIATYRRRK